MKRLWNYTKRILTNQKGFVITPLIAGTIGTAALLGGGAAAGMFGGGGEKEQKDDPLAPIRQQLMGLAAGVPEMVEARKKQIGEMYGAAKEEGLADIGEDVRGRRGWGPSSIETRLGTELREKLGRGQASAELGAEEWGLSAQMRALGGAGSVPFPQEEAEEAPWWQDVLGSVGEVAGYGGMEDIFEPKKTESEEFVETEKKKRPVIRMA